MEVLAPLPGVVSVIIPVFERADYLHQAVQSALGQSYPDIEIIVVDDGSSEREVSRYHLPGHIRFLRRTLNGGPSAARNAGLAVARGEFIAFLDSDDAWMPQKLSRQVALLRDHPRAGLTFCHVAAMDERGRSIGQRTRPRVLRGHTFRHCLRSYLIKSPSTVLLRRELLEEHGGFNEGFRHCEDRDLWLRLALKHEFLADPEELVFYRTHPGQLTDGRNGVAAAHAEVELFRQWLPRVQHRMPRLEREARRALGSAYRRLAKALLAQGKPSPASPWSPLREALRIYPWDHRTYLKLAHLGMLAGWRGLLRDLQLLRHAIRPVPPQA